MMLPPGVVVVPATSSHVDDAALESLLKTTYVDGGFTDAAQADVMFAPTAVRARGDLLVALGSGGDLLGMVIAVCPGAAGIKMAAAGEAELHLLAVRPDRQTQGIGAALVEAALETMTQAGATRVILWTQPMMAAAQRLYERHGFAREPTADFLANGRSFLVFVRPL